jgi:uncharacterized protein YceH (UPF0502 family)
MRVNGKRFYFTSAADIRKLLEVLLIRLTKALRQRWERNTGKRRERDRGKKGIKEKKI